MSVHYLFFSSFVRLFNREIEIERSTSRVGKRWQRNGKYLYTSFCVESLMLKKRGWRERDSRAKNKINTVTKQEKTIERDLLKQVE